jgi:hypothetical protein
MKRSCIYPWNLVLALAGCAGITQLQPDPRIPAARGTVEAITGKNGNTKLQLAVKFLAEPVRVRPGSSVYVVWVQGPEPGARPQNLGALRVNQSLSGSLTTVTPLQRFSIFLTCEDYPAVETPTGEPLMFTQIVRR